MNNIIFFIPLLFIVFFSLILATVSLILSFSGGWRKLASRYRAGNFFQGDQLKMQSARMGMVSYRSILTIGADRSHLFMGVPFLFKLGHPNLSIPLIEVQGLERRGIFHAEVLLTFHKARGVTIIVKKNLGDMIERNSQGSWSYKRL